MWILHCSLFNYLWPSSDIWKISFNIFWGGLSYIEPSGWLRYERHLWIKKKKKTLQRASLPSFCIPKIPIPHFSRKTAFRFVFIVKPLPTTSNYIRHVTFIALKLVTTQHGEHGGARKDVKLLTRPIRPKLNYRLYSEQVRPHLFPPAFYLYQLDSVLPYRVLERCPGKAK